jgi:hypothetical protein
MDYENKILLRPDAGRLKKARILLLIAFVVIVFSISGLIFLKGYSVFAFTNFAGFVLFFYALLHPWSKASYYAMTIPVFLALLLLCIMNPSFFLNMVDFGKIPGHGAEDLAWVIGGIFFAGLIAGIFGVIRCLTFRYDDD